MDINNAACDLAREVANEGGALVAGGLSPVPGYKEGKGKEFVQGEFRKQCNVFKEKDVDFLLGEVGTVTDTLLQTLISIIRKDWIFLALFCILQNTKPLNHRVGQLQPCFGKPMTPCCCKIPLHRQQTTTELGDGVRDNCTTTGCVKYPIAVFIGLF